MIEGKWLSTSFLVGMEFCFNKLGYVKVGFLQEAIDDSVDLPMGQFASSLNQLCLVIRISKARNLDCVLGRQFAQLPGDAGRIRECIERLFVVAKFEDKRVELSPSELGYYGLHFDVRLKDDDAARIPEKARPLHCEIQVQTRAHNLWADFSHDVTYKSPTELPAEVIRQVYRLVALLDLVDSEIQASRDAAVKTGGFEEGSMLVTLDRYYFELTGRAYDSELSFYIVHNLKDLYDEVERRGFDARIHDFVESHRERLAQRYADYGDDDRANPLLFQPEALMIIERLQANSFAVKEAWERILPLDLLENLANLWGMTV